jgi:hypothetical protein
MERSSRNAPELRQLSNRTECLVVKSIKNCVVDNGQRRIDAGVAYNGGKVSMPSIFVDCRAYSRLQAEHGNKFIVDLQSRKFFPGEK